MEIPEKVYEVAASFDNEPADILGFVILVIVFILSGLWKAN